MQGNLMSKRVTTAQPEKNLDVKDSKAQSEANKIQPQNSKDSKAISEAPKVTDNETDAATEAAAELIKETKRLSIQDNEEVKETTPSKKRNYEEMSGSKEESFHTAQDKTSNDSKKVTPENSKRLKMDESPPKNMVEMNEGEKKPFSLISQGENKPEEEQIKEKKPEEPKSEEAVPETSVEAVPSIGVVKSAEAVQSTEIVKPFEAVASTEVATSVEAVPSVEIKSAEAIPSTTVVQ